jgi:hypothetical protein
MTLPEGFQFSQASLQDYVDCPRRFQLRYLVNLDWPAVEAEPVLKHERHMERAGLFHQMVHQLLCDGGGRTGPLVGPLPRGASR